MDARVDITDIYAFQKPGHPSKSILILILNETISNARSE